MWLHRYFNIQHLPSLLAGGNLSIRFAPIRSFSDNTEGWHPTLLPYVDEVYKLISFEQRLKDDSAEWTVENQLGSFAQITEKKFMLNNDSNPMQVKFAQLPPKEKLEVIASEDKKRKYVYASCWFESIHRNNEKRYMWDLYARKRADDSLINKVYTEGMLDGASNELLRSLGRAGQGIMVSVLKDELIKEMRKHKVRDNIALYYPNGELVDWPIESERKYFTKHKSYEHEQEYRFIYNHSEQQKDVFLNVDISTIHFTIWNDMSKQAVRSYLRSKQFSPLNLQQLHRSTRTFSFSEIRPESSRGDLDQITRW